MVSSIAVVNLFIALLPLIGKLGTSFCLRVNPGSHYNSAFFTTLPRFVASRKFSTSIRFYESASRYVFDSGYTQGGSCSHSWNKAFGRARCLSLHHTNSDRFVFRRPGECVLLSGDGTRMLGENLTCPWLDYVEVAAYSYDQGLKPFQHYGTLLQPFDTKLKVGEWHYLEIAEFPGAVHYLLRTSTGETETKVVSVYDCGIARENGYELSLYFGGRCPAPQSVEICYQDLGPSSNAALSSSISVGMVGAVFLVLSIVVICIVGGFCSCCCSCCSDRGDVVSDGGDAESTSTETSMESPLQWTSD